jgi:stage II sporulation protein D
LKRLTLLLGALVLACSSSSTTTPKTATKPKASLAERFGGRAPTVRVHLKSFGEWTRLPLTGKGGLTITPAGGAARKAKSVTLRNPGEKVAVTFAAKSGVFTLGTRTYAGDLVMDPEGRLINRVPLENYVLGVLRGEIPLPKVPVDAAAAQAIAVRSYTLHYLLRENPVCDVDDTTLFQVYAGMKYAPDDKSLREGVNRTSGQYMEWNGAPLKAYYHSTCGGHTTDVPTGLDREPVGCMQGVPCDWCKISKYYTWQTTITEVELRRTLRMDGPVRSVSVGKLGPGKRALGVNVVTDSGKQYVHGSAFRLRIGPSKLRSTRWDHLSLADGSLQVRGGGWGHGVGMCQMGAIGRAQEGQKANDIVLAYYRGATIESAY